MSRDSDWDRFNSQFEETEDERNERLRKKRFAKPKSEIWHSKDCLCHACMSAAFSKEHKTGIFRDHACWKCDSGTKRCIVGNPRQCEYLHARND